MNASASHSETHLDCIGTGENFEHSKDLILKFNAIPCLSTDDPSDTDDSELNDPTLEGKDHLDTATGSINDMKNATAKKNESPNDKTVSHNLLSYATSKNTIADSAKKRIDQLRVERPGDSKTEDSKIGKSEIGTNDTANSNGKSRTLKKISKLVVVLQPERLRRLRRLGLCSRARNEAWVDPVKAIRNTENADIKTALEAQASNQCLSIRFTRMWHTYLDEAKSAARKQNYPYALHLIKLCKCLELTQPAWQQCTVLEASCLTGVGEHQLALDKVREVLSRNPHNVQAQLEEGVALEGCGEIELALVAFYRCLKISPNYRRAHCLIGRCTRHIVRVFSHIERNVSFNSLLNQSM